MNIPIRILYIDDSKNDRELARHVFENDSHNFEIVLVSNRKNFEEELTNSNYDLILTDFNILGIDGFQIVDVVRAINTDVPIIVITGTGSEEAAVELMKKGISDYVIKSAAHIQKLPSIVLSILENQKIKNDKIKAQHELEISLQKYRVLFESFPLGVTVTDSSGTIVESNDESERLLGISKNIQMQRKYDSKEWKIIKTDGTSMLADEFASVRAAKENRLIKDVEMGVVKDDNNISWINVTAAPIPLEGYGVAITYSDITEKKKAEEYLRINEERLRYALDATSDALWDWDIENQKVYFSPRYYSLLGYETGEFEPSLDSFKSMIHPDDVDKVFTVIEEYYYYNREHHEVEFRMRSKSGGWLWILSRGKIVGRKTDGSPRRMVGAHTDLTLRRKNDEDLRRKNRALRILSECNGAIVKSKEENELSDKVCRIISSIGEYPLVWIGLAVEDEYKSILPVASYGRDINEILARNMTWNDDDRGKCSAGKAIRNCHVTLIRNIRSDQDQILWLGDSLQHGYNSILSLPLLVGDRCKGVLSIYSSEINDFDSEEIKLLAELTDDIAYGILSIRTKNDQEKLRDQLFQAQKSEAIGRLAGGIAHDFNNILTIILGNAELMTYNMDNIELAFKQLGQIKMAAEKAASLTHQLLAFSRKEIIQPRILCINSLVLEMESLLHRLIGEDIHLTVKLDPDLLKIKADHSHIDQVIMNLVVNARDAMPNGGKINIKTYNSLTDETHIHRNQNAKIGSYAVLEVEDNGNGIKKEIISKIFDPFFSTKSSGKGTGLGLSVVDGIVSQNQGWIDVESEIGKGSSFKVYFPALEICVEDELSQKEPTALTMGNGEKILVLEDELVIRELVSSTLSMKGYKVFEAMDLSSAFEVLESEKGEFDLVFSDIILPDGSGIDFYEKAIMKYPNLRVIFTSGYADEKAKWESIQNNSYSFIPKPYKIFELLGAIRKKLS